MLKIIFYDPMDDNKKTDIKYTIGLMVWIDKGQ